MKIIPDVQLVLHLHLFIHKILSASLKPLCVDMAVSTHHSTAFSVVAILFEMMVSQAIKHFG